MCTAAFAIFCRTSFSLRITADLRMTHSDRRSARAHDADGADRLEKKARRSASAGRSDRPTPAFADEARSLLATRFLGRAMQSLDEAESTNTLAAEWIDKGAPHGAVVVADHQTRGRGRQGRSWVAQAGLNLTFSVILRPDLAPDRLGMLTIAACVGVARAIDRFADPLRTSIKWPNDVYLNDRKMCGMLLEASWNASGLQPAVVLGIGLNVNQDEFPEDIRERATSILVETGRIVSRAELFAAVLADLEHSLQQLDRNEEEVRERYLERMLSLEEEICLRFARSEGKVEGVVRGIDASGAIILETRSGRRVYHAGEVTRAV